MEFLQKLTEENVEQLLEFLRVKSFGRDLTLALTTLGLVPRIVSLNVYEFSDWLIFIDASVDF